MITREADYAMRAIALLILYKRENKSITTLSLSEEMHIPYRFLRKIMMKLSEKGFVESRKGRTGGLSLIIDEKTVSILDILSVFSTTSLCLNKCTVKKEYNCQRKSECKLHPKLKELQSIVDAHAKNITLDQLV